MSEYTGINLRDILAQASGVRIIVNNAGEAVSGSQYARIVREAEADADNDTLVPIDMSPYVMFVRGDGWILGAARKFENVAYRMWQDEWVGFIKQPNEIVVDIIHYQPEF